MNDPVPKRLDAFIGGYMGPSYKVVLQERKLIYTPFGDGYAEKKSISINPAAPTWREFRQALDELNVWEWQKEYPNPRVIDGDHWSFEVAYDDRSVKTHGSNNYPRDEKASKWSESPFSRYLAAVSKLLGGRKFH